MSNVSSTNKPQVSSSLGSPSTITENSISNVISIFVETSQYLEEHRGGPIIVKSAAESQAPAESGEHSQIMPPNDEWDGEVVEEVLDGGIMKYRIAWEPTLEPEGNLSAEMRKAWEDKKAELAVKSQQAADKGRSKVVKHKRPGRPRRIQDN